jgi:hypothetical protein
LEGAVYDFLQQAKRRRCVRPLARLYLASSSSGCPAC